MSTIRSGRFTIDHDDEITVFLIGMRLNHWWRPDRWLPVFAAMPRMLRHLSEHPDAGMLGFHQWVTPRPLVVSYWRSPEHLQRFASDPDAPHAKPWRDFVRKVGDHPSVGIWHETYVAGAGSREVMYVNMPPWGLGAATEAVEVGPGLATSKQRLRRRQGGSTPAD